MRRLLVSLVVVVFGVGVTAPIAAAGFDKASGHVDQGGSIWDFNATSNFNGSEPRGSVKFTQPNSDPNTVYTGKVTCLNVVGNMFQATGPITSVRNFPFPGFQAAYFVIQGSDSGKFAPSGSPDTFSGSVSITAGTTPPSPPACVATAVGLPVTDGNVIVEDSSF
jgi:hypothetical protein